MNYRHIFHAGNFADVLKHALLLRVIESLQKKDKGLCLVDAHAGIGRYPLFSEQAQKTNEHKEGIALVRESNGFAAYLKEVKAAGYPTIYPGSPLLLQQTMRKQDRLILNELHKEDFKTLKKNIGDDKQISFENKDAYAVVKGVLPPIERRGLFLIDPPFEEKDEFDRLIVAMDDWKKRFATGVFMIWYPIKAHLPAERFKRAAAESGFSRVWYAEGLKHSRFRSDSFNGSGVILLNAPYPVPEEAEQWLPEMKEQLGLYGVEHGFLTEDK